MAELSESLYLVAFFIWGVAIALGVGTIVRIRRGR